MKRIRSGLGIFVLILFYGVSSGHDALPVEELCELAWEHGNGMPANLVVAQIYEESGGQPEIRSSAGAVGLMQIIEKFHPDIDLTDPATNIDLGTQIMVQDYFYLNHIRGGFSDVSEIDWTIEAYVERALWGYVMGPGNVVWYDQHLDKTMHDDVLRYGDNIIELDKDNQYCLAA